MATRALWPSTFIGTSYWFCSWSWTPQQPASTSSADVITRDEVVRARVAGSPGGRHSIAHLCSTGIAARTRVDVVSIGHARADDQGCLFTFVLVALVAVVTVFHITVGADAMRTVMTPEVDDATITAEELDAHAGNGKARRAYRHGHGHAAKKLCLHRLEAAHDLANEIARAGGRDTDRVRFARVELHRLNDSTSTAAGRQH